MKRAVFLEVNGAVSGVARDDRWFRLPDKKMMLNSVRFGNHAYSLGRTMQMLPLGDEARAVEPEPSAGSWRLGARKVLDLLSNRRLYFLTLLQ